MQLIDAGMVAFAAWHAVGSRIDWPLTYQVPRMLRKMLEGGDGACALFWDAERLEKRERFPPYRDRPEIWDEAGREDFETLLRTLTALGVVQYRSDGREADELLAAVRHRLHRRTPLLIRSDDKDFMQLLSGACRMRGRVRGEVRFSDVRRILGVTPAYVADLLALAGDQADGIPRIVPPAKARELIARRGHVRDWRDRRLRSEDRATRRRIEANREQLRLNVELVDLSMDAVGSPPEPILDGLDDADGARRIGKRLGIGWLSGGLEEWRLLRDGGRRARRLLTA